MKRIAVVSVCFAALSLGGLGMPLIGCTSSWIEDGYYGGTGKAPQPNPVVDGGSTGANAKCIDPKGFDGKGCFSCKPSNNDELLTACTESLFETFDNTKRITNFNPSNPKPAIGDQGPALPPYEAPSSTPDPNLPPAPPCPIATKPNPVMVLGATGFPMETIAKAMGTTTTIFYLEKGSCEGVAGMILNEPKLSGEVVYYDQDGTKNRCVLQETHSADITLSGLFAESCANQDGLSELISLPAGISDFLGPVSTVMFAVPATSSERAISAEAAYRVYGYGDTSALGLLNQVAPWTEEPLVFRRRPSSGNQQTTALSLGLPLDGLRGRDSNGSSNMLSALRTSAQPQRTIGISSSEIVDTNRDVVKALAYQHYGQPVAFYPDSDPAKLDRRNVRDGHYFMWMPLHVLSRTVSGDPVSVANPTLDPTGSKKAERDAAVKRLIYVMVNRQQAPVPSIDLFGALKRGGNVPQCAMRVKRTREGAPLEPYNPGISCGCAFEAAAPGSTEASCQPCKDSGQCTTLGKTSCSFGFCE